jgi:hypothetical protein
MRACIRSSSASRTAATKAPIFATSLRPSVSMPERTSTAYGRTARTQAATLSDVRPPETTIARSCAVDCNTVQSNVSPEPPARPAARVSNIHSVPETRMEPASVDRGPAHPTSIAVDMKHFDDTAPRAREHLAFRSADSSAAELQREAEAARNNDGFFLHLGPRARRRARRTAGSRPRSLRGAPSGTRRALSARMTPTASAPASTASATSCALVMPQNLTRVRRAGRHEWATDAFFSSSTNAPDRRNASAPRRSGNRAHRRRRARRYRRVRARRFR